MMDETERGWYFERNKEESAYWERSLALQTQMVEEQKGQSKIISTFGGIIMALLLLIYFHLGGSLIPTWLSKPWH